MSITHIVFSPYKKPPVHYVVVFSQSRQLTGSSWILPFLFSFVDKWSAFWVQPLWAQNSPSRWEACVSASRRDNNLRLTLRGWTKSSFQAVESDSRDVLFQRICLISRIDDPKMRQIEFRHCRTHRPRYCRGFIILHFNSP